MERVVLASNNLDKCISTLIDEYSEINEIFNNNKIYFIVGRHAYDIICAKMHEHNITFGINRVAYNKIIDIPKCHLGNSIFVFTTEDPKVFDEKYKYFMSEEVTEVLQIPKIEYCNRTNAKKYLEYFDSLPSNIELGFDYETNGMPFRTGFEITGFSISSNDYSVWFDYRYPITPEVDINDEAYVALKWFLDRNQNRLWTFNVSFETKVSYQLFDTYYKFQDTRAVAICYGINRGSLKEIAQRILKIPGWTSDEVLIRNNAATIMSRYNTYQEYADSRSDEYKDKEGIDKELILKAVGVLDKYTIEDELMNRYWKYEWGVVPTDILGYYCCLDSYYTLVLKQRMYGDHFKRAYDCYLANQRLAFELGCSGICIDTKLAKMMYDKLGLVMTKSRIILDQFITKYNLKSIIDKINSDYHPNEKLDCFANKFGNIILHPHLGRHILNYVSSDKINYVCDDEKVCELFDESELGSTITSVLKSWSGKGQLGALYRKRSLINALTTYARQYIQLTDELIKYNSRNFNDSYYVIKNYVTNKVNEIKKNITSEFDQYDYDLLGVINYVLRNNIEINSETLDKIKGFFNESVPINTRIEIISKYYKNKDELSYLINVGEITEDVEKSLKETPYFTNSIAKYLGVKDKDKLESLNKYFSNFIDYINSISLIHEMNSYSDLESYKLLDDNTEVTIDGKKVNIRNVPNKINYQSPAGKTEVFEKISDYYKYESLYSTFYSSNIDKKFPEVTYENFKESYDNNEEVRKAVDGIGFNTVSLSNKAKLTSRFTSSNHHGIDHDNISINIDDYSDKLTQYQVVLLAYVIQNNVAKEVNTYLSNLLFASSPIDSKLDGYYIIGDKKPGVNSWQDPRPYCYQPAWAVNMMATRRWGSGWHTFVPGSDTLSVCVFEEDEVGFYFDISQAEVRTIAYLCKDEEMIKLYEEGKDVYKEVIKASHPEATPEEVAAARGYYKSVVLGKLYGRGNRSIAENISKSLEETAQIISNFFGRFKQINSVIRQKVEFCKEHGYIDTYLGDRIYAEKERASTVGINYFIQNATAVILAEAFNNNLRKQRELGLTTTIKSVVHDSNIIGVKVKDIFLVIMCCRKYFHDYVMNKYHINYEYDLIIHLNIRDKVKITYNHDTSNFKMKGPSSSVNKLMSYLNKYYEYDIVEEKITDPGGKNSILAMLLAWNWKHHNFYCDNNFRTPEMKSVEINIHNIKDKIDQKLMEVDND